MKRFLFFLIVTFLASQEAVISIEKGPLKVVVASANPVKINAVEEIIKLYSFLSYAQVIARPVPSLVSEQPLFFEEIVLGAKNRAENAFEDCDYSVGLESGLFKLPGSESTYMCICVCTIYDGEKHHLGLSCGFVLPPKIVSLILNEGMNLGDAAYHSGLTTNPKLGSSEGAIGVLTKGRITRTEGIKHALTAALISLENKNLYEQSPN
jgi:inosine/xanthosine triphosphatase